MEARMAASLHPAASHHLPAFITAPGETDVLMVAMAVLLILAVLGVGILFLRLHTLPERIAHKGQKLQFEVVAVLGLLALFTHIHLFWVAALLLALVEIPDFGGPLGRIAGSVETIAGIKPGEGAVQSTDEQIAGVNGGPAELPHETIGGLKRGEGAAAAAKRPALVPADTGS
jgi:hypothetical protein